MANAFKINKLNIYILFIAIYLLISLNPYYVWGYFQYYYTVSLLIVVLSSIFFNYIFSLEKILPAFTVFMLTYIYYILNGASVLGSFAFSFGISFLCCINNQYLIVIFKKLKLTYALILLPGLLLWVIHIVIGSDFLSLGRLSDELNPSKFKAETGEGYILYPFTVVLDYMLNNKVYRFMGPFDEPGLVGTVSALILAANKLKFRRFDDYIVLFSGIASLSLAFYILFFIYLTSISLAKTKYLFMLLAFITTIIVSAGLNDTVRKYTMDRIVLENGKVAGDNRDSITLNNYFHDWSYADTPSFLTGLPSYAPDGTSSWKIILVKTGFAGALLFLAIFIVLYLSVGIGTYSVLHRFGFIGVFLISIYQRPAVLIPAMIVIFLFGVINSKKEKDHSILYIDEGKF